MKNPIQNIYSNSGHPIDVQTRTTFKNATFCCALCQISANDDTKTEELEYQISRLKQESKLEWNIHTRASGERACFIIVCPYENNLRANLQKLNFTKSFEFPRRNGYPQTGNLEMWNLSW